MQFPPRTLYCLLIWSVWPRSLAVAAPLTTSMANIKWPPLAGKGSVFSTGKLIGAGTKSIKAAHHDLRFLAKAPVSENLAARVSVRISIRSIFAAIDMGASLDLSVLSKEIPTSSLSLRSLPRLSGLPPNSRPTSPYPPRVG
jgi:hypothetical protein